MVNVYRSRRQPVHWKIDIIDVFKPNPDFPSLQGAILADPEKPHDIPTMIDNLSVARVTLVNKGNQDLKEFKFGLSFEETNQAIHLESETLDRHHVVECSTGISLSSPAKELDLTLKPFNRGEAYSFNIQFTYIGSVGTVRIGTAEPVNLVEIGATTELMKEMAIQALKQAVKNNFPKI